MPDLQPTCPTCRRPSGMPSENPTFPFCTDRCRLVDLGAWFNEEYRVPGKPAPMTQEDEPG